MTLVDEGAASGPRLIVTDSEGTVSRTPGIDTGGVGSGFFPDPNESFVSLTPIAQATFNATLDKHFVVGPRGDVRVLEVDRFVSLDSHGVTVLDSIGPYLLAGLKTAPTTGFRPTTM